MSGQPREEIDENRVPPGIAYRVPPAIAESHWASIEGMLQVMEGWTQCLSAADIRQGVAAGQLQLWTVADHAHKVSMAITRVTPCARGSICTVWLIASTLTHDDCISALTNEVETHARAQGCAVLEFIAYPTLAERLQGKITGVTVERDLRLNRRVN